MQGAVIGRKMDFLMQEFNREANTLCSKSQDSSLTAIGLDLKVMIDQMREQIQNVEFLQDEEISYGKMELIKQPQLIVLAKMRGCPLA